MAAEYRSAGLAAQALAWGIGAGVPVPLLRVAGRVVQDELDHAELSHRCRMALGGAEAPVELPVHTLVAPGSGGLLASLTETVVRDFCLGETLAVPLFVEMRRRADQAAVVAVLDRVLADETVHRSFGWETLDALLALDPDVATWVSTRLPALRASFAGYQWPADAPPLTAEERSCGLIENHEYGEIFARTWAEEITPRFARRGIRVDPLDPPP